MTNPELPPLPVAPFSADADEWYGGPPHQACWYWPSIEAMLRSYGQACYEAGVANERERCRHLCLDFSNRLTGKDWEPHVSASERAMGADECAELISKGTP